MTACVQDSEGLGKHFSDIPQLTVVLVRTEPALFKVDCILNGRYNKNDIPVFGKREVKGSSRPHQVEFMARFTSATLADTVFNKPCFC